MANKTDKTNKADIDKVKFNGYAIRRVKNQT